ncbi:MAG: GNAT family N-acetyltransferase [Gammaproteobacteria bacterium]|nr:GNAT family N-acetyltransferase [Gammaproteobacteria bacterium]
MKTKDNKDFEIRPARREDVGLILRFIKELAEYEKMSDQVMATEQELSDRLFGERPEAETLICFSKDEPAGFALYFENFSTFRGRKGIYLEDLYVRPEFRGSGLGKKLLQSVAKIARDRDCVRLEWQVLDWNKPAKEFYEKLGARHLCGWEVYRLTDEALQQFAEEN